MSRKASQKEIAEFDAWSFCRSKGQYNNGEIDWYFTRLMDEPLLQSFALNAWSISGNQNKLNECVLSFRGELNTVMTCAHCGKPLSQRIDIERHLILKPSEQEAEAYDQDALDEHSDVVSCPGLVSLQDWFEDELMLSLPMLPRHELCEESPEWAELNVFQAVPASDEDQEPEVTKVKPFAGLADLIKSTKK